MRFTKAERAQAQAAYEEREWLALDGLSWCRRPPIATDQAWALVWSERHSPARVVPVYLRVVRKRKGGAK